MTIEHPRLLLIDSYDSFTFNLAALCRLTIPDCIIYIIKNDHLTIAQLLPHLAYFSAIIVGPGPGSPDIPEDIGLVNDLWKLADAHLLPIFGVCLGLQSLGTQFGANLKRLPIVKHGQASQIDHIGTQIFEGVGAVHAVRYHSLHIVPPTVGDLEILAWADDEPDNGRVVMAIGHKSKPFWAVQYHPESVCSDRGGFEVLLNFWRLAEQWSQKRGRRVVPWDAATTHTFGRSWPYSHPVPPNRLRFQPAVRTLVQHLPGLPVTAACELFGARDEQASFALLDSAAHPGRYSILGVLSPNSYRLTYYIPDTFIQLTCGDETTRHDLGCNDVWTWLAAFMRTRRARDGDPTSPFWGGLIGYLSYELGVHSLQVLQRAERDPRDQRHPDVNMVFVERSVVIDSLGGNVYIQSLIPQDAEWLGRTAGLLARLHGGECTSASEPTAKGKAPEFAIILPDRNRYISRINQAKEHLFSGDSYELCLTAHTRIRMTASTPNTLLSSWERYKLLRRNNPAPHSAYLRLKPTTLLSSSPERFLSFSRSPNSICQLRPIKGTVRKAPGITRAVAEQLLAGSTKEVAENLMIVDLIRHDLYGVVGEDVQVKQFCKVEEYETVWQLVSVIEGKLPRALDVDLEHDSELGWEVLRHTLPPGSMTGAPKKRSIEILQKLEDGDRSVYSGVFGYWCVGGGGDWSVTIRSCFKHTPIPEEGGTVCTSTESLTKEVEEWTIGAGGAITALSDAEAEWDEMVVKLQSVLRAFGVSVPESS